MRPDAIGKSFRQPRHSPKASAQDNGAGIEQVHHRSQAPGEALGMA
jgi:hypothetical protein